MDKHAGSIFNRNFICVFLVQMLFSFSFNAITAYVADYSYFLGAAAAVAGFLSGWANGVAVFLKPITVPLQVRANKVKLLRVSCLLGAIACLGYIVSPSLIWFTIFLFISGAQVSITVSLTLTMASESVPAQKLTSGLAIFGLGGNLGNTFGPMIAEKVMHSVSAVADKELGYKAIFLLGCILHLVSVVATLLIRMDDEQPQFTPAQEPWYKQIFELNALVPAIMLTLIFAANRLPNAFLLLYCEELSLPSGGAFFLVQGFTLIATRLLLGRVLDKLNIYAMYLVSAAGFAGSFLIIGFATTITHLICAAALLAVSVGTLQPILQTMCIRSTDDSRRTVACNTSSIGTDFGCFIGPTILGGQVYAVVGTYSSVYKLASVPIFISMGLLFIFMYQQKKRQNNP